MWFPLRLALIAVVAFAATPAQAQTAYECRSHALDIDALGDTAETRLAQDLPDVERLADTVSDPVVAAASRVAAVRQRDYVDALRAYRNALRDLAAALEGCAR